MNALRHGLALERFIAERTLDLEELHARLMWIEKARLELATEFERQVFEGELEDVEGQLCRIGAMDRYAKRCFSALRKRRD